MKGLGPVNPFEHPSRKTYEDPVVQSYHDLSLAAGDRIEDYNSKALKIRKRNRITAKTENPDRLIQEESSVIDYMVNNPADSGRNCAQKGGVKPW